MEVSLQIGQQAAVEWLENFPAELRKGIRGGLERAAELLERAVMAKAATPLGAQSSGGLGEMARSVTSDMETAKGRMQAHIFLAPPADPYGEYVEVGTRPHFPPPAALESWVRKRMGVTNDGQARQIAFLISRKISRHGTQGQHLFERALQENEAKVIGILEEEIGAAVG